MDASKVIKIVHLLETVSDFLGSIRERTMDDAVEAGEALKVIVDGFTDLVDQELHANN